MSYVARTMYAVTCDECGRRLREDGWDGWYMTEEDADWGGAGCGWQQYEQPDGDPRHVCPQCVEEEDNHDS